MVLHLADKFYHRIHQVSGTHKGFLQDVQSLTRYFLFDSWQHLINLAIAMRLVFALARLGVPEENLVIGFVFCREEAIVSALCPGLLLTVEKMLAAGD